MLQRSSHEAPVDVPAIPATVAPGGVVDWPVPIAGFEQLDAAESEALPAGDAPADPAPKTTKKRAATASATDIEEPTK